MYILPVALIYITRIFYNCLAGSDESAFAVFESQVLLLQFMTKLNTPSDSDIKNVQDDDIFLLADQRY